MSSRQSKYTNLEGAELARIQFLFDILADKIDRGVDTFEDEENFENEVTGTHRVIGMHDRQKYMKYIIMPHSGISRRLVQYLNTIQAKYQVPIQWPRLDGQPDPKSWSLQSKIMDLENNLEFWKKRVDEIDIKIEEYVKMNNDRNVDGIDPKAEIEKSFDSKKRKLLVILDIEREIALLRHAAFYAS